MGIVFTNNNDTTCSSSRKRYSDVSQRRRPAIRLLPSAATLLLLAFVGAIFPGFCHSWKSSSLVSLSLFRNTSNDHGRTPSRSRESVPIAAALTISSLASSLPSQQDTTSQEDEASFSLLFPTHRPVLAIITETDACDTEDKMERTYEAIRQAVSTRKVDLVSVRLSLPSKNEEENDGDDSDSDQILERACVLTEKLVQLSSEQQKEEDDTAVTNTSSSSSSFSSFRVVCSSDLVSVAVRARAHGVHVKEHHLDQLADIMDRFDYPIVIGTSTHSVESALNSYFGEHDSDAGDGDGAPKSDDRSSNEETKTMTMMIPRPHYYFVGTCYLTASHPEKTRQDQLEGPELPGRVKRALLEEAKSRRRVSTTDDDPSPLQLQLQLPRILAIGGIDETNCHDPVALGADGVAVIRAVLQADHPVERVEDMQSNMMMATQTNKQTNGGQPTE